MGVLGLGDAGSRPGCGRPGSPPGRWPPRPGPGRTTSRLASSDQRGVVAAGLLGQAAKGGVGLGEGGGGAQHAGARGHGPLELVAQLGQVAGSARRSGMADDSATSSGVAQMTPSMGRSAITGRMAPVASGPLFPVRWPR